MQYPSTQTTTTTPTTTTPTPFTLFSLSSLLPTLLLLFFLTSSPLLHPHSSSSRFFCQAMDVQKLCQARCYYGRGGNLCNCNAFHFAGKRSSHSSRGGIGDGSEGEAFQLGSRGPLLELALADVEEEEEGQGGVVPPRTAAAAAAGDVLQGIPLASLTDDNSRGEDRRPTRRAGLFDVSRAVVAEEEEAEEKGRERAVNRLSSLIKTALDERLIDRYEGSRRKQSALPYEEAEFVY